MDHREHAERTIASAEKGYSDMLRYFISGDGHDAGRKRGIAVEVQTAT
jgi:hypothetical protein